MPRHKNSEAIGVGRGTISILIPRDQIPRDLRLLPKQPHRVHARHRERRCLTAPAARRWPALPAPSVRATSWIGDIEGVPHPHAMHARSDHDDLVAMMITQVSDTAAGKPRGLVQWGEPLQFDLRRDGDVVGSFARHGVALLLERRGLRLKIGAVSEPYQDLPKSIFGKSLFAEVSMLYG
jgi:hypothetical protein